MGSVATGTMWSSLVSGGVRQSFLLVNLALATFAVASGLLIVGRSWGVRKLGTDETM